ncbi:hypothetical protein GDO86_006732 [Hymenochirus boettgeri]|uniref:Major facilitator superfamily (MFS) profile domain-containing protein n=1 Tax=Hymenochirus boettgeri TaxID=247094 RepID=A0A8T2JBZ5_9PIPI|nr:hypothetical protein GDO86_006732 [Hymenochirus boettgeri]
MVNPFVGFITNRIGYDTPLFCGFCFTFMSAVMVTLANSYALLMVARGLHGIGSCCTSVAGMGLLADVYPDDYERGKAMGFAMSVMAIGLLGGAPFGSVMYQFTGKEAPFLVIAGFALVDGALQLYTLKPLKFSPRNMPLPPYRALLTDPYILIAAGSLCICNLSYGILEPTLTIRMMEYMCSPRWELGLAFLPSMLTFMIVVNVFGMLAHKIGR